MREKRSINIKHEINIAFLNINRGITFAFLLFLQVIVWLIGLVFSTKEMSLVPVEAEAPTVSETVDPSAIASVPTTAERRHHHHHGYGYGQSYYGNGYGYSRPYSGYRGHYGCVISIMIYF